MKFTISTLAIALASALLPFILSSQTITVDSSIFWADFQAQNGLSPGSDIPDSMIINIENGGELIIGNISPGPGVTFVDCNGIINVNAGGILKVEGQLSMEKKDTNQVIIPTINVIGILNNQEGFINIRTGTLLSVKPSGTYNAFGTIGLPTSGFDGGMNIAQGGIVNLEGTGNLVGGSITINGDLNLGTTSTTNRNTKSNIAASLICTLNGNLTVGQFGILNSDPTSTIEFKDIASFFIFNLVVSRGILKFFSGSFLYIETIGSLIVQSANFVLYIGAKLEIWGIMELNDQ